MTGTGGLGSCSWKALVGIGTDLNESLMPPPGFSPSSRLLLPILKAKMTTPTMRAAPAIEPTTAPAMTPPLGPSLPLVPPSVGLSGSSGSDVLDGNVADELVSISVEDSLTDSVVDDSLVVVVVSVAVSPTIPPRSVPCSTIPVYCNTYSLLDRLRIAC